MGAEGNATVQIGQIVEGVVAKITNYGAFVDLPSGRSGLVHISEIADTFVRDIREYLREGQTVRVKVLGLNERGKLDLSVKQALSPEERANRQKQRTTFEEKLKAFLKQSEERLLDLKRNTEAKRGGRGRRRR
ncbi:MAG: S1 RNA-binding domain-containing protein [Armatimonadota bacterium]|nr:S1 RNA-binding domain-containing protein [Armatimonadota bacterium]MDR5696338.1 S1 RNA-binding domain-containing protein [Armatimonadota bacterium]